MQVSGGRRRGRVRKLTVFVEKQYIATGQVDGVSSAQSGQTGTNNDDFLGVRHDGD
jgi:hypothetical protein